MIVDDCINKINVYDFGIPMGRRLLTEMTFLLTGTTAEHTGTGEGELQHTWE